MDLSWMAWTWQTGVFFGVIALFVSGMIVWELCSPGGAPRKGVLSLDTTRGDRLFISLLSAAFIHLAWLGVFGSTLWGATLVSVILALAIFRWV